MWKFIELEHHRCLILGEPNTGKTQVTQTLLDEAEDLGRSIAVIDMAPERKGDIGGKLVCHNDHGYYTADIVTPRLSGRTEKEIIELAELNKRRIDSIFEKYRPKQVLFINDVSIYLQRGEVKKIVDIMSLSETCIMNGYFGVSLGNDPLSTEERRKMTELQKFCDRIMWR